MKVTKTYVDTSVFGGVFDTEFEKYSKTFFNKAQKGKYQIVVSEITFREIEKSPPKVKDFFGSICEKNIILASITEECLDLADKYLKAKVVTSKYRNDAFHVAVATVYKVDLLLSWNFKHIVNRARIHKFNAINLREGYSMIEIFSPREVIYDY